MSSSPRWRAPVIAACFTFAAACDSVVDADPDLTIQAGSLISIVPSAADATCPHGGSRVDSGLDNGDGGGVARDGMLQAGEVDASSYICNGAPGAAGAAGADGASGANGADGTEGAPGVDGSDGANGADGADGANGADGADGAAGADGQQGPSGYNSLVVTSDAGSACAAGGVRVDAGVDDGGTASAGTAGNGILEQAEIDDSVVVCNGANGADGADGQNGADGSDGFNSLMRLTPEGAGEVCVTPGFRIDVGLDNGENGGTARDGVLQAGEVDSTAYLCERVPAMTAMIGVGLDVMKGIAYSIDLNTGVTDVLASDPVQEVNIVNARGGAAIYQLGERYYVEYNNTTYDLMTVSEIWVTRAAVDGPRVVFSTMSWGIGTVYYGDYTTGVFNEITGNETVGLDHLDLDIEGDWVTYSRYVAGDRTAVAHNVMTSQVIDLGPGSGPRVSNGYVIYRTVSESSPTDAVLYKLSDGTTTNLSATIGDWVNEPTVDAKYAVFTTSNYAVYLYKLETQELELLCRASRRASRAASTATSCSATFRAARRSLITCAPARFAR